MVIIYTGMWVTSECINHGVNCMVCIFMVKTHTKGYFRMTPKTGTKRSSGNKTEWKTTCICFTLTIKFVRLGLQHKRPYNTSKPVNVFLKRTNICHNFAF